MKLGSLKEGGRDGTLIVVSRDLSKAVRATGIAPTLQRALEDWDTVAPRLAAVYEALAQAGGVLTQLSLGRDAQSKLFYMVKVDNARFSKQVVPGDVLELHVQIKRVIRNMAVYYGEAKVDGELVAKKMRALRMVGVPYTDTDIAGAGAAVQDKTELDALVAYLQGLGLNAKSGG